VDLERGYDNWSPCDDIVNGRMVVNTETDPLEMYVKATSFVSADLGEKVLVNVLY
jgi:hypothetical protein